MDPLSKKIARVLGTTFSLVAAVSIVRALWVLTHTEQFVRHGDGLAYFLHAATAAALFATAAVVLLLLCWPPPKLAVAGLISTIIGGLILLGLVAIGF